MLIGLHPLLSPDLLHVLASMGHGDDIVIADANFPGASNARRLIRADGANATDLLDAVLSVLPLDAYVAHAAHTMEVVGDAQTVPPVVAEFHDRIGQRTVCATLDRFAFYDLARDAFAIVQSGENRLYGNIILKKGVV